MKFSKLKQSLQNPTSNRFINHKNAMPFMAIAAAIILTAISIGLLVIYGADVSTAQGGGEGFLPFDAKTRGYGLGGPAMILPIIAFFISRKEGSKGLGVMILISGILIIIGGIVVLAITDPIQAQESGRNLIVETGPLIGIGAFIIALGSIKLKQS